MLLVIGTVPDDAFPLVRGMAELDGDDLVVDGMRVPVNRGTPALIGAALAAQAVTGQEGVETVLVGDTGRGKGSRALYEYLVAHLGEIRPSTMAFHYLQPDVDYHNKVLFAVQDLSEPPVIIADAGFMYAAKMSGQALSYDLFTPDVGELSFLADETAPHPFYTRGFILHQDALVQDLIQRAYRYENGARHLLVKGACDYVVDNGRIVAEISRPSAAAMEAMGGTGDTVTGLVSALIQAGYNICTAAKVAALTNRVAGVNADPTPATQVIEIIRQIPGALETVLGKEDAS